MPTTTAAAVVSHPEWWSGAAGAVLGAILGALIGSCVPLLVASMRRERERGGEIHAMRAEVLLTMLALRELLSANILAPLYHLPSTIFSQALPKIIGDGVLSFDEVGMMVEYLNKVEEINRGLDRARAAAIVDHGVLARPEYDRNCAKATELLDLPHRRYGDSPLLSSVQNVLDRLEDMDPWWVFWAGRIH